MKKIDVLIVYESKVRELENDCLLKYELENRGFTVEIVNTWNELYGGKKHRYHAKVVIAPAMYNDGIYDFLKSFCGNVPKVVNLQWEQIGPVGDRKKQDAWYILKGIAKQCMNICWGINTYERLKCKAGIDEKHLLISGHMSLDFARPEFAGYYKDKNTILYQYSIPTNKEINLFISSFSYVNLPENLEKQSLFSEVEKFKSISVQSFQKILEWFEKFLDTRDDQIIIYRPHPAESDNILLKKMSEKYKDHFYVISDFSVKQWILISDRVYTWYSTSSAEAYAFEKPICVLRPVEMPIECETELLENAKKITLYEDFEESFYSDKMEKLGKTEFEKFYYIDEKAAYIHIADAVETVMKDDNYHIRDTRPKIKKSVKSMIKTSAHKVVEFFVQYLPVKGKYAEKYKKSNTIDEYSRRKTAENYASPEEVSEICNRIKTLLENT